MTVISEPGLYSLILRSRKPEAKAFKRWVTHEVLPSIRKHGMYATPATIDDMLANPDIMINALMRLKEERAARAKAEAEVEAQRPRQDHPHAGRSQPRNPRPHRTHRPCW